MTKLKKSVSRVVDTRLGEMVITIGPGTAITLREKGKQFSYGTSIETLWYHLIGANIPPNSKYRRARKLRAEK